MVRLQTHLKYFVVNKITNDPLWQGRRIFLSGHEVGIILSKDVILNLKCSE